MEAFQLVAIGLMAAVLLVLVRQYRPELALQLSLAAGIIIFLLLLGKISSLIDVFEELAFKAEVNRYYLGIIVKIIGIAYMAEFAAQVCRDANEGAMASKIELGAKILIMLLAVPIVSAIIELVWELLP